MPANGQMNRRHFLEGTALVGTAGLASGAAVAREYAGGASMPGRPQDAGLPSAPLAGQGRFFTADERRFIHAAVDRLIPADPEWPGAADLGVVDFLDNQLAGAYGRGQVWYMQGPWAPGAETQGYQSRHTPAGLYRTAIKSVDAYTRQNHAGRLFADLPVAEQDAVLTGLDEGTIGLDGVDGKTFFEMLLQNTIEGFFGDPVHGGNRDMIAWKMIGFPGARYDYRAFVSRHNERLDLQPVSVAGMTGASIQTQGA